MPIYETEADRDRERYLADLVAVQLFCDVDMTPRLTSTDWRGLGARGEVMWVAENKCRKNSAHRFPTLWVECSKVRALEREAARYGLDVGHRGIFAAMWTCGSVRVFYHHRIVQAPIRACCRLDRAGETPDPCYDVPVKWGVPLYSLGFSGG
jgi:hypothetical protein